MSISFHFVLTNIKKNIYREIFLSQTTHMLYLYIMIITEITSTYLSVISKNIFEFINQSNIHFYHIFVRYPYRFACVINEDVPDPYQCPGQMPCVDDVIVTRKQTSYKKTIKRR